MKRYFFVYKYILTTSNLKISVDLKHFEQVKETHYQHYFGEVATFNDNLIAIGGKDTRLVAIFQKYNISFYSTFRTVEVLTDDYTWRERSRIGYKDGSLHTFNVLTIPGGNGDDLFIFGLYFK